MAFAGSYHFSDDGQVSNRTAPSWNCNAQHTRVGNNPDGSLLITSTGLSSFSTTSPSNETTHSAVGQVAAIVGSAPNTAFVNKSYDGSPAMTFRAVGNYSYDKASHASQFDEVTCDTTGLQGVARVGWHQNNPAFGLMKAWRYDDHIDKVFGTFVRDSYGRPSFMLGTGRQWPLLTAGTFQVDGGVVGGLWYRSELTDEGFGLRHQVVPFLVPALSVTESTTGLGLDALLAPRLKVAGHVFNAPTTLMFQLNYLISTSEKSSKSVSLSGTPDGGLMASFGVKF